MIENIIGQLFVFISWVIGSGGYTGVMLLMAIESACIPLPSELIMPFAGYLVYKGQFNLYWVATAGAIGCNLGSVIAYEVGSYGGRPLVQKYGRCILLNAHHLERTDRLFPKSGVITIFHRPLLPAVRT